MAGCVVLGSQGTYLGADGAGLEVGASGCECPLQASDGQLLWDGQVSLWVRPQLVARHGDYL